MFHIPHIIFAATSLAVFVPADTSSIRAKLRNAFTSGKQPEKKVDTSQQRRLGSDVAKERAKRKELMDELANEKTTAARKDEIIKGLEAQLETTSAEKDELAAKVEELAPRAKAWNDFERKERAKLIESFPPEKRKGVQKIADSLDIDTFREYAQSLTGKGATQGQQAGADKGKGKDWETIIMGENADKEIAADPDGFNAFMEARGK